MGEPQIVVSDVLDAGDEPIEGVRELVLPTELLERGRWRPVAHMDHTRADYASSFKTKPRGWGDLLLHSVVPGRAGARGGKVADEVDVGAGATHDPAQDLLS